MQLSNISGVKLVVFFLLVAIAPHAQMGVIGKWETKDDETGEVRAVVELYERNGLVNGKILSIMNKEHPDPVCEACDKDDDRFGKKIIGMEIIRGMKKFGDYYSDGSILDPENGNSYRCKIWIEGNNLMVRGYWGIFYRTQVWRKSS